MEVAFGILGAVASIVGLLLPAQGWRQRCIHLVYGVAIIVLAFGVVTYQAKLDRIASVERAASQMISNRRIEYTNLGFIQASLAFLEKNRDLYPDTYQRALTMCAQFRCDYPYADIDNISMASGMEGLLKGIAVIGDDS